MTWAKNLIQTLIGIGLLLGLAFGLIGLFRSVSGSPTASQSQQTIIPTAEAVDTVASALPQTLPPVTPSPIPTREPRSGDVLFESAGELYRQQVDEQGTPIGSAVRVPINQGVDEAIAATYPSPNGQQVIFFKEKAGPPGSENIVSMYVLMLPNWQVRPLFGGVGLDLSLKFFGWHPNGRQVVYFAGGVQLLDVNTDERTLVVQPGQWDNSPYQDVNVDGVAFSPDEKKMAVSFTRTGEGSEIWMANADGSEPQLLFRENFRVGLLTWSPDGQLIAFIGNGVEVMQADGQNRRTLGMNFIGGFPPAWSPDSRYIAFTAEEEAPDKSLSGTNQALFQGRKIHISNVLTGEERRLIGDQTGGEIGPTWSPDSAHVMFLSNRSGASEVWLASLNSTELRQLTSDTRPKRWAPVWLAASGR